MDRMPRIIFTLEVDCDTDEPDQFLLVYDGEILGFEDDSDQDVKIRGKGALLVSYSSLIR